MNVRIYKHVSPVIAYQAGTTLAVKRDMAHTRETPPEKKFKESIFVVFLFGNVDVMINILNVVVIFKRVEHLLESNQLIGV